MPRSGLRISKRFILRSLDLSYDCEEEGDRPYVVSMQYKVFYTLSRSYPSSAERLSNGVRDAEAQQRQAGEDNLFVRSDGSLMGQASYSTTMNIYAHSFEARKYAAQKKLNEFMQENACAEG